MSERATQSAEIAPKCVGLWGRIFGHRFTKRMGDYVCDINYCGRCGLRPWTPRIPPAEEADHG